MSRHIKQLRRTNGIFRTSKGKTVEVHQLVVPTDEKLISEWAKHFREQYCDDLELDEIVEGTEYEGKKGLYLKEMIFPSGKKPGPSIRAGDFAEVLVADYLEFTQGFWVPRNRIESKATRDESVKGSDVISIKFESKQDYSVEDTLVVWESKAKLSSKSTKTLQTAVDHSGIDFLRYAHTLNATRRRFRKCGKEKEADKIKRFQNLEDNPFKLLYGAVAICTTNSIDDSTFFSIDESKHPKSGSLYLLVFHGTDLMTFVHKLYQKAIDEAGS